MRWRAECLGVRHVYLEFLAQLTISQNCGLILSFAGINYLLKLPACVRTKDIKMTSMLSLIGVTFNLRILVSDGHNRNIHFEKSHFSR